MGMLRISFTGLLRRSRQMDVSDLPGQSMRAVPGVVHVSRSCVAPLGTLLELGVSGSTWSGEGKDLESSSKPLACNFLPCFLGCLRQH